MCIWKQIGIIHRWWVWQFLWFDHGGFVSLYCTKEYPDINLNYLKYTYSTKDYLADWMRVQLRFNSSTPSLFTSYRSKTNTLLDDWQIGHRTWDSINRPSTVSRMHVSIFFTHPISYVERATITPGNHLDTTSCLRARYFNNLVINAIEQFEYRTADTIH